MSDSVAAAKPVGSDNQIQVRKDGVSSPLRQADGDKFAPVSCDDVAGKPSVHNLLEVILTEQEKLLNVFQDHQQILFKKLDDLKLSSTLSTGEAYLASFLSKTEPEQNLAVKEVGDLEEEAQQWFVNSARDHVAALPREELNRVLKEWIGSTKPMFKERLRLTSEEDVDRFISELDTRGDGMISEQEFKGKLRQIRGGMSDGIFELPESVLSILKVGAKRSLAERVASSSHFDALMSFVIVANMINMLVALQLKGMYQGSVLGLRTNDIDWVANRNYFLISERVFNAVYLVELMIRFWAQRCWFFKHYANIADALVVGLSCLDSFVLSPSQINFINVSILRLFRITRCVRLLKVLRYAKVLTELRVMVDTLYQAIRGVFWAMVLLGAFITAGASLMTQLATNMVEDSDIEMDSRIWLYTYFGTVAVSMHTMFECTFSGHWWFYTRPLIEDLNHFFAVFWISWVVLINFAAMRVIGAIFLKQTMNASIADAERYAMMHMKRKAELSETLRLMFKAMDTSGDGAISQEEFNTMISNKGVVQAFGNMGLGVDEVSAFFCVLASDDGQVDYDEFVNGALAMATSSPTLDNLKALQNQLKMKEDLEAIIKSVEPIKKLLPVLAR